MEEKKKQTEPEACKVAKKCGGCQYQGVPYKEQLKKKQKMVNALLSKYGKVEPIIGMENPYYYRNKVHAVFDRDRKGNIVSGTYEAKTHRVVPVENCLIEDKKSQEIIRTIRGLLKSFKIKTYDEDTGYGLFRHVLIRRGFKSGEIMVVLVLGSPILPSSNNFVKALRKEHPEITTVVLNINDRKTSMILGEREKVLYGKGFIRDELCGCTFRISPKSFYQVNPVQTEADKGFLYIGKRISRSLKNESLSGLVPIYDHSLVILADEDEEVQADIAICKSNSGISGSRLAAAHVRLGEKIGRHIAAVFPEKNTSILVLERGGRFFGDGVYMGAGGIFYSMNPKQDDAPVINTERVVIVDSVINTGKSIMRIIDELKNHNPGIDVIIAANVIQNEAVELFKDYLVFATRLSKNSFVGVNQSKQTGKTGPDTADRLFNLIKKRY